MKVRPADNSVSQFPEPVELPHGALHLSGAVQALGERHELPGPEVDGRGAAPGSTRARPSRL